ncbi:PhoH family protein [Rossellomorea marisflavi]|uniref:PhoH family protein n=1 Tax=Rossellomorea marisflavi TaxID=189381 RepID=UPI003F9FD759
MTKFFAADTNILLDQIEGLDEFNIVLLSSTLRELDKHKSSPNGELAYKARKAVRYIKQNRDKFKFDLNDYKGSDLGSNFNSQYQDDNILKACVDNGYGIITNDVLLQMKSEGFNVEVKELNDNTYEEYKGIVDIYLTDSVEDQQQLAEIYENRFINRFNLVINQYLYFWDKTSPTYNDEGEINGYKFLDSFRFDGEKLVDLKHKPVKPKFTGDKVKPINKKQEMLFDLLQNEDITIKMCLGKFGVGKDYVMISHALQLIEEGKMDKIIWARNNVELADVPTLGILPGEKFDKLVEFAMPLADHVGGVEGLIMLIKEEKLEIQHLGSLRGRDIKNSIIYCTEFQNNTTNHAKLLVGRVGKGSELWVNGDLQQTDADVFRQSSAVRALTKLKGNFRFGQVTLDKTERSDTAELADFL